MIGLLLAVLAAPALAISFEGVRKHRKFNMMARCVTHVTSLMLCSPFTNALQLSTAGTTDVSAKVFSGVKDDPYILEDWLEHHMEVFGPSNIYLFDDASELPLTIQILNKAAQKGVIAV